MDGQLAEQRRLIGRQGESIASCEQKNARLYEQQRDLIARYRDRSLGEVVLGDEPVTGVHKVDRYNMLQEFRDRADEEHIVPRALAEP
mgnify:CR=1 FL=1